jgi:hypothetical protein
MFSTTNQIYSSTSSANKKIRGSSQKGYLYVKQERKVQIKNIQRIKYASSIKMVGVAFLSLGYDMFASTVD